MLVRQNEEDDARSGTSKPETNDKINQKVKAEVFTMCMILRISVG